MNMESLTEKIEKYIRSLLEANSADEIILRRKELANVFGCVPSQINYVLQSRFTPERGFIVESQRGGNGYIRIIRVCLSGVEDRLNHIEEIVDGVMTPQETRRLLKNLEERELLTLRERTMLEVILRFVDEVLVSFFDLPAYRRDEINTELVRRVLKSLAII
jgi:transcriptional regulator CtsR